jgi:iron complex outermembrane receptor protein
MRFILLLAAILITSYTKGQTRDSLKSYKLEEITVKSGLVLEPKSITNINTKQLQLSDAVSLIDIGKYIPSVKAQTNSRGESLFYLRGSSERQISLFFDGVPLNIPWDNRIDLSLIPTDAVSEISITKGTPSTVYGANTPAGVININSDSFNGKVGKFSASFSDYNFQKYSGSYSGGSRNLSYLVSGSYKKSDGFSLPASYSNNDNLSDKRVNTYNESYSVFGKLNYYYSDLSNVSFSTTYIDANKGVAPETNVEKPRYWQYPLWRKVGFSSSGSHSFTDNRSSFLTYTASFSKLENTINQYQTINYSVLDEVEKSDDNIFYGRLIYTNLIDLNSLLKLSASGMHTTHDENILEYNSGIQTGSIMNVYSQNVFSVGAEYEYIDHRYTAIAGLSYDVSSTPQTGDKPGNEPIGDYAINTAFIYSLDDNYSAQISLGRKTRFPTLRESFSGALGRFLINPDLKAEVAYSSELGINYVNKSLSGDLIFFYNLVNDGIVRTVVEVGGDRKFQRINKDEIRNWGLEILSGYTFNQNFQASLNFTYLNSFAKNENGDFADTLEYKPEFIGGVSINYVNPSLLNILLELNYIGTEFGLREGNSGFEKLPDYTLLNLRFAKEVFITDNSKLEFYLRINNILDRIYFTQWGLPEAGREIFGGVKLEFR